MGVSTNKLTKVELFLLEAELFTHICDKLKEIFRKTHKNYFLLMRFTIEMENNMLEANFIRFVIEDILSTEEYTLKGIAYYTDTHEDVIQEVAAGRNTSPPAKLLRRIIDLHRSVKRELYQEIIKKIATEYLALA